MRKKHLGHKDFGYFIHLWIKGVRVLIREDHRGAPETPERRKTYAEGSEKEPRE